MRIRFCIIPKVYITGTGPDKVVIMVRISCWNRGLQRFVCMNDLMAGGVYDRMEERGMLPGKEVSVTGYDNRELSGYYKPAAYYDISSTS